MNMPGNTDSTVPDFDSSFPLAPYGSSGGVPSSPLFGASTQQASGTWNPNLFGTPSTQSSRTLGFPACGVQYTPACNASGSQLFVSSTPSSASSRASSARPFGTASTPSLRVPNKPASSQCNKLFSIPSMAPAFTPCSCTSCTFHKLAYGSVGTTAYGTSHPANNVSTPLPLVHSPSPSFSAWGFPSAGASNWTNTTPNSGSTGNTTPGYFPSTAPAFGSFNSSFHGFCTNPYEGLHGHYAPSNSGGSFLSSGSKPCSSDNLLVRPGGFEPSYWGGSSTPGWFPPCSSGSSLVRPGGFEPSSSGSSSANGWFPPCPSGSSLFQPDGFKSMPSGGSSAPGWFPACPSGSSVVRPGGFDPSSTGGSNVTGLFPPCPSGNSFVQPGVFDPSSSGDARVPPRHAAHSSNSSFLPGGSAPHNSGGSPVPVGFTSWPKHLKEPEQLNSLSVPTENMTSSGTEGIQVDSDEPVCRNEENDIIQSICEHTDKSTPDELRWMDYYRRKQGEDKKSKDVTQITNTESDLISIKIENFSQVAIQILGAFKSFHIGTNSSSASHSSSAPTSSTTPLSNPIVEI